MNKKLITCQKSQGKNRRTAVENESTCSQINTQSFSRNSTRSGLAGTRVGILALHSIIYARLIITVRVVYQSLAVKSVNLRTENYLSNSGILTY